MRLSPRPREYDFEANGQIIHLSPSQSLILTCLMGAKSPVTGRELIDVLYGDRKDGGPVTADLCIRVMISDIRKKLRPTGVRIVGKSWRGYQLEEPEKAKAAP